MMINVIVLLIILLLSLPLVTLQLRLIYHQRYNHQLNALNNDNNDNNDNLLPALDDICQQCIENSKMKFRQGLSKAFTTATTSNTGNQIMNEEDKLPIMNILNNTILSPNSNLAKYVMNSSQPLIMNVSPKSFLYTITLFHVPNFQQLPKRRNIAGTILLYKALYGKGVLISSLKARVIQQDELQGGWKSYKEFCNNDVSIDKGTLLTRIGGPTRSCEWKSTSMDLVDQSSPPLGYLEIAIFTDTHPPTDENNWDVKNDAEPRVESDESNIIHLEPSREELDSLLTYHDARQAKLLSKPALTNSSIVISEKEKQYGSVKEKLSLKIGGLSEQLDDVLRRLLASRRLPPETLQSLGLSHVRGLLLHGKPGTGKTLIAREIAKALNAREPKIVNGPEILDKFVGEAEKNIRELFRDADEEWDRLGYKSELHIIILDELDAIAKRRGLMTGDNSGVRDSVVNQLLTKIDGVRERNNCLVIGMTNRVDLIDPALIRPGRLEVIIEIPEPDRAGREEILLIMMKSMVLGNYITISEAKSYARKISIMTSSWTGADLSGLMRSAASFAIDRYHNQQDEIHVRWSDIEAALKDMRTVKRLSIRKILYEKFKYYLEGKLKNGKPIRQLEDILNDGIDSHD